MTIQQAKSIRDRLYEIDQTDRLVTHVLEAKDIFDLGKRLENDRMSISYSEVVPQIHVKAMNAAFMAAKSAAVLEIREEPQRQNEELEQITLVTPTPAQ